jgi:glycosyltransferase involved in cell wall biosynthesis
MEEVIAGASAAVVLDLQSSGLKIKTVELATAGLPIVSWPVGLEGTGLTDGQSCSSVSTAEEFKQSLQSLHSDAGLRERFGGAARATMVQRFSRAAASEQLTRLRPRFAP